MSSAAVGAQTPVLTVCSQADPRRVVASVVIDVILLAAPGVLARQGTCRNSLAIPWE